MNNKDMDVDKLSLPFLEIDEYTWRAVMDGDLFVISAPGSMELTPDSFLILIGRVFRGMPGHRRLFGFVRVIESTNYNVASPEAFQYCLVKVTPGYIVDMPLLAELWSVEGLP